MVTVMPLYARLVLGSNETRAFSPCINRKSHWGPLPCQCTRLSHCEVFYTEMSITGTASLKTLVTCVLKVISSSQPAAVLSPASWSDMSLCTGSIRPGIGNLKAFKGQLCYVSVALDAKIVHTYFNDIDTPSLASLQAAATTSGVKRFRVPLKSFWPS